MRLSLSLLAAVSRRPASKLRKPAVSLDHRSPPSSTRDELHSYARQEFERHREVSDLVRFAFLSDHPFLCLFRWTSLIIANYVLGPYSVLIIGKAEFDTMKRYIEEQVVG
ncbi:hypothetical protein N7481_010542 [Penicillium waksmanii]|uniref:uncharacterized protein n=1 Tax=Penicillium waksmanii TaxID=69791 RepID=UPI0025469899|nr:uncharacterized protein N7481_010542 [Penicillium waksmanii]KAJ5973332.1 hypothetical protein N7481_010542 [Penicillium waksmanii]